MLASNASGASNVGVTAVPLSQARGTSGMRIAYWACQLGGWGSYTFGQGMGEILYTGGSWHNAIPVWGLYCLMGIGGTHCFRSLIKKRGWPALPAGALARRVIASSVVLAIISTIAIALLCTALHGTVVPPLYHSIYKHASDREALYNFTTQSALFYGSWMGIYFSLMFFRQHKQAELHQLQLSRALQTAELRLLKSQLNPHFLFNSLNSVRALIADDPGRAQDAVTQLARTLRYTLSSTDELITFERELETVEDYLALESLRLAERLKIERRIADAAMPVRIPVMLLQTIIENAIKHGIAPLQQGGTLRMSADVIGRELVIVVENPRSANIPMIAHTGVGLANARERLRLLFDGAAALHTDFTSPSRARVTVHLPA